MTYWIPIALVAVSPLWLYAASDVAGVDRFEFRAYVTSIGVAAGVAWAASRGTPALIACSLLLLLYAVQARTRSRIWKTELRYCRAAVIEDPGNLRARVHLGLALMHAGRAVEAEDHFWFVYGAMDPIKSPAAVLNLVNICFHRGEFERAESIVQGAMTHWRVFPDLLNFLAAIHMKQEKFESARLILTDAIAQDPTKPAFFQNRADCSVYLGDPDSARADYATALRLLHPAERA